jgi:hypothetical protein
MELKMPELKLPKVKTEIQVSKEIKAGVRTIFTVIRISILATDDGNILGSWLKPQAFLIIEPGEQYAVSISGEQMSIEKILELAPSLKEVVEKARGIHRIKVD